MFTVINPYTSTRDYDAITRHGRAIGIVVSLATASYLLARGFGLI